VHTLDGKLIGFSGKTTDIQELQLKREAQMLFLGIEHALELETSLKMGSICADALRDCELLIRAVYEQMASSALDLRDERAAQLLNSMNQHGLVSLVSCDEVFASSLVEVSSGCASGLQGNDLAAWLRERGIDLVDVMVNARDTQRAHGFTLLHETPDGTLTCIF
jgi:hypothetical protein